MIKLQKLEDLIRDKVPFGPADSRGFYSLKCQCCHDYKVRAGFKFENNNIGYNCWNCGTTGRFEEFSGHVSKNFRKILNAYGIEDSDIDTVLNSTFFNKKETESTVVTLASLTKVSTSTPQVKLPPKSIKLGSTTDFLQYQEKLADYLLSRKIDIISYPFFFSMEQRFLDRVIIPFYRNSKLIYWQARSINPDEKKRYDNAAVGRDAVMFNIDRLTSYSPLPLFVTEGVFDAMMFDGVAILGSKLTPAKIELLKASTRRLVFVIDKDSNGRHVAEEALSHGWEITFVPDGAEDLNKSVRRFGKAWTALQIANNIPKTADSARLAINMNCK